MNMNITMTMTTPMKRAACTAIPIMCRISATARGIPTTIMMTEAAAATTMRCSIITV